jgi:hypothetical protein
VFIAAKIVNDYLNLDDVETRNMAYFENLSHNFPGQTEKK